VESRDVGGAPQDFDPKGVSLNIPIFLHTFELLFGCHQITAAIEDPDHLMMTGEVELRVVLQEVKLLEGAALIMIRVSRSLENF